MIALAVIGVFVLLPLALFVLNGLVLAARTTPQLGTVSGPAGAPPESEVKFLSWNIAKAFAHKSGFKFDTKENVRERLRKMAAVIEAEKPDFVFLSEALTACGPCEVNQVEVLAQLSGMAFYATGENYNVGVPFFNVAGGNAVLSRTPLTAVANIDLAGRKAFWVTRNNRRALFVSAEIGGKAVLMAALHNDSFDMRNNEAQTQHLLDYVGDRPAVLAGDFNNRPEDRSIKLIRESGKFGGAFDGPPTFFEGSRKERIDYVFVPAGWELLDHRVIENDTSDHRPLVCRFKVTR
ncbi:MAG TPA: endonuclease/exonuclease/phosphatase family protein [Gemmataceae bacterium]|nr:endonuclease/exonuclease/phosphatase family protein [Gemmataceae bacterium]